MIREMPQENPKPESPDDAMMMEFVRFIGDHRCTADQIRKAYYRLCGVSEDEGRDVAVEIIAQEMKSMTARKFPLNRFAVLVGAKQEYEDSVKLFSAYVDQMAVSDREKQMLHSIVDQRRAGEMTCFVNGRRFGHFVTGPKDDPQEVFALRLMYVLRELVSAVSQGEKYELSFAE